MPINTDLTDLVREASRGRWREILPQCGVPAACLINKHQPCPGCGGRDRFRFDDADGRGTFFCSQGGGEPAAGDGFSLIQHVRGWGFRETVEAVADVLGISPNDKARERRNERRVEAPTPEPSKPSKPSTRTTLAPSERDRWATTRAITRDDPAGRYLIGRGCAFPHPDGDLHWHPKVYHRPSGHTGPALIALVTDFETCEPVTLHFTWIRPDGSGKADIEPDRLTLGGHTNIGLIRLWPDSEVTDGLAVAEGVESALTVARGFTPTWATMNAGNLKKLPVLGGIEALTIVADADDAGMKAAAACADRWAAAGAEVRVWRAQQDGQDPNDVWRGAA